MRPDWDAQFSETYEEKRERWAKTRAKRTTEGKCWQCAKPIVECKCSNVTHKSGLDPRDPDPSRPGIFRDHNCWKCRDGAKPCIVGNPHRCEFPHARND